MLQKVYRWVLYCSTVCKRGIHSLLLFWIFISFFFLHIHLHRQIEWESITVRTLIVSDLRENPMLFADDLEDCKICSKFAVNVSWDYFWWICFFVIIAYHECNSSILRQRVVCPEVSLGVRFYRYCISKLRFKFPAIWTMQMTCTALPPSSLSSQNAAPSEV